MHPRSRTWDEKRDFIRMKVDTEVTITVEESSQKLTGYCRDLSGTGMLLEVREAVPEGKTCRTSLNSPSEAFPSLDATIKVIRCTRLDDERYQLGTEIIQIDH
jgi:c-di-GMP-binding flagellar brake protein YcgR